jgi:hypothetical protein
VVNPTLEDFQDAHRRACLHEAPHPPKIKSDEMRDLVIWSIALRISAGEAQTLLVSRDEVHSGSLGTDEAKAARLVRLTSLDEALEYLEVRTPSGEQLLSLLDPWWDALRREGLPLGNAPQLKSVGMVTFVQGTNGPSDASGTISIGGADGILISGDLEISVPSGNSARLFLRNIHVGDVPRAEIMIEAPAVPVVLQDSLEERLASLRKALGGAE